MSFQIRARERDARGLCRRDLSPRLQCPSAPALSHTSPTRCTAAGFFLLGVRRAPSSAQQTRRDAPPRA